MERGGGNGLRGCGGDGGLLVGEAVDEAVAGGEAGGADGCGEALVDAVRDSRGEGCGPRRQLSAAHLGLGLTFAAAALRMPSRMAVVENCMVG